MRVFPGQPRDQRLTAVPEHTHAVLRGRAAAAHQSLQEYLRMRLIEEADAALADDSSDGDAARARLRGHALVAPEVTDVAVLSVLRRQLLVRDLDARRAELALADLVDLPLRRVPHRQLLRRCWELRQNLTVYDAAYVAVAELLNLVLITGDARLSKAPGLRCRVDVVS